MNRYTVYERLRRKYCFYTLCGALCIRSECRCISVYRSKSASRRNPKTASALLHHMVAFYFRLTFSISIRKYALLLPPPAYTLTSLGSTRTASFGLENVTSHGQLGHRQSQRYNIQTRHCCAAHFLLNIQPLCTQLAHLSPPTCV